MKRATPWAPERSTATASCTIRSIPRSTIRCYAALVELDEGVRLVTNLVDVERDDIRIGMRVEVTFVATADDARVPVFRPSIA